MENEVKESAPSYNYISPEEYLEMESASDVKHEYYDGKIFTMAGATWEHNVIVKNIATQILPFLKGKSCDMFGSDLRIYVPENGLFTYPDFSIICSQPKTTGEKKDTITNPSVLIEVLSKSTRNYDRIGKFKLYRSIKTLQEYILVDSTSICIEIYKRDADNSWHLWEFNQLSDSVSISTIGFTLFLKDVYEAVNIDE